MKKKRFINTRQINASTTGKNENTILIENEITF